MSSKLKILEISWTALKQYLTASDCTVTPFHGRIIWEGVITSRCTSHVGVRSWGTPVVVAATAVLQHRKEKSFHITGWLRGLQLSPQQHHFSVPSLRQGMFASCSAWICCKRKTYLSWKSKEMSLFLPYGCLYWKPKGETLCSIEARLVLMRLIQQPHKTTADYHWLQRKLNHTPRMHMITNSKSLANTVSNHHPYSQISSLYKHLFQVSHFLKFYVPKSWVNTGHLSTRHLSSGDLTDNLMNGPSGKEKKNNNNKKKDKITTDV